MSWSVISAEDLAPQAWKNGGGQTRELLAWPNPSDWIVRLSVADIERDGPFSAFEGIQRWFAVLRGDGVRLYEYELRVGDELLSFDGALAPDCELIGGATRDFNLMHRRSRGRLIVQPADHPFLPEAGNSRWLGLFTAGGGLLSHGARAMPLRPLSLAWCESPARQSCIFDGEGAAWWMAWSEAESLGD
ncbi:HutD family protein [Paucibacter sp. DJ1R-11]|uniref:HutD/Ves family protein n=1 Tax=Paucibacter sp. DJ1R-11 TaxID=2893556 RepID=UPI0021E3A215|nr:HutD family protein [Paucibacter sp. DJ1R-11]MCV2365115.1 HutD family protein [Paucibacter sp. DJ1R-11]